MCRSSRWVCRFIARPCAIRNSVRLKKAGFQQWLLEHNSTASEHSVVRNVEAEYDADDGSGFGPGPGIPGSMGSMQDMVCFYREPGRRSLHKIESRRRFMLWCVDLDSLV